MKKCEQCDYEMPESQKDCQISDWHVIALTSEVFKQEGMVPLARHDDEQGNPAHGEVAMFEVYETAKQWAEQFVECRHEIITIPRHVAICMMGRKLE